MLKTDNNFFSKKQQIWI